MTQGRPVRGSSYTLGQRWVAGRPVPEHCQLKGQRCHTLLRPVVEVPLHPAPFGVPGLHDPLARGPYFLQLGPHLGLQPLVLDRHPGRRRRGTDQPRVERRIVDQRRQRLPVPLHHRHRSRPPPAGRLRQR